MARPLKVVWAAPALDDLDEIAARIATDNPVAAAELVGRVLEAVDRLRLFPASGRRLPELPGGRYREAIVAPCRLIYRADDTVLHLVHVTRGERPLRLRRLR